MQQEIIEESIENIILHKPISDYELLDNMKKIQKIKKHFDIKININKSENIYNAIITIIELAYLYNLKSAIDEIKNTLDVSEEEFYRINEMEKIQEATVLMNIVYQAGAILLVLFLLLVFYQKYVC